LRASQTRYEQQRGRGRDHCRRRNVREAAAHIPIERRNEHHDDSCERRGEPGIDAHGPSGGPRHADQKGHRKQQAEHAPELRMETKDRPRGPLRDVEQGPVVLVGADFREADVRPMVRDQPRPGAEGHRIPVAVGKRDGEQERDGEKEY
jgi:hypothetical protein